MKKKFVKCAGAKCDHNKLNKRTRVRANQNLDVRGACMQRQKGPNSPSANANFLEV
jgi:hypothetical protein